MWPWGHVAVGYLCYSAWRRHRGTRPGVPAVYLVTVGAVAPDLVDKPLAWTVGLLESGRSLGHSWLVAALVFAVLWAVATPRVGRGPVVAFAVGYLSHAVADLPLLAVVAGEVERAFYFAWPLLSVPPPETRLSLLAYLLSYEPSLADGLELLLVGVAGLVWHLDGRSGVGPPDRPAERPEPGVDGRSVGNDHNR